MGKTYRPNIFLKFRPVFRWVIKLRSSPKAIAGGMALGTFIAFTPTYGVQIFLAVFFATLFNFNRPAALVPVWITNPLTIAPVYTFNYWIGCFMWPGPPVGEVSKTFMDIAVKLAKLDFWDIDDQLCNILSMGMEVIIPLSVGSLLVGLFFGGLVYWLTSVFLTYFFARRRNKRVLK